MYGKIAGFLLLASLIFGYGCATASRAFGQSIALLSNPSWAEFRVVGDSMIYNTPSQLRLTCGKPYLVRIEKDGYEPVLLRIGMASALRTIERGVNANGSRWNVEALSEAQYRLIDDTIIVTLKPLLQSIPEPELVPLAVRQVPLMEDPKPKKTLEERLAELDLMRKEGKISAKKYKALKKKAAKEICHGDSES